MQYGLLQVKTGIQNDPGEQTVSALVQFMLNSLKAASVPHSERLAML